MSEREELEEESEERKKLEEELEDVILGFLDDNIEGQQATMRKVASIMIEMCQHLTPRQIRDVQTSNTTKKMKTKCDPLSSFLMNVLAHGGVYRKDVDRERVRYEIQTFIQNGTMFRDMMGRYVSRLPLTKVDTSGKKWWNPKRGQRGTSEVHNGSHYGSSNNLAHRIIMCGLCGIFRYFLAHEPLFISEYQYIIPIDLNYIRNESEIPIVDFLLEIGADPNSYNHIMGRSVLSQVVETLPVPKDGDSTLPNGDASRIPCNERRHLLLTITALIDAGADPNVSNEAGWFPLGIAVSRGDLELVELLLAGGADNELHRFIQIDL